MQEIIVGGIIDPTFDWDGIICTIGQDGKPGLAMDHEPGGGDMHTFVKDVAHGAIIQNGDPAQIRLDAAQILNICSVAKGAMLAVEAAVEELAFLLQPIDDRVGVLLHTGGEDDELVPLAHLAEEFVAVRTFVDVVEDGVLRTEDGCVRRGADSDRGVELDFDHVAGGHAAAFGEGMDQGFVQVQDEGLLESRWPGVGSAWD